MKRVRNAAQGGRKLHLDPEHLQVLLSEEIYGIMSAIEAKEMRKACKTATSNDNATSSEISGSGSGRTVAPGASAGATVIPMDAASRGASRLLREEIEGIRRRKKH